MIETEKEKIREREGVCLFMSDKERVRACV